jgi:hypothetical protein
MTDQYQHVRAGASEMVLKTVSIPLAPPEMNTAILSSFAIGLAGVCLILSGLWRGSKISLFMLPAAALMVAGPLLGIPAIGPLSAVAVSALIGFLAAVLAFWLGRENV